MLFLALVVVVIGAALVADVFASLPSRPLMPSDAWSDQGTRPSFSAHDRNRYQ